MADYPPLRDTVCHLVHRVDFLLNRENGQVLEPYGVTMYQAMSLIYVADHEGDHPVNQREIGRYTQLSNPGVTKLVSALERLGLLERHHDDADGRNCILRTTPLGRERSAVFRRLLLESDEHLTSNLTKEEREQLTALLKKLYNKSV